MRTLFALAALLIGGIPLNDQNRAWASPIDTHYCQPGEADCKYWEAYLFTPWDDLTDIQRRLLFGYLTLHFPDGHTDYKTLFQRWSESADDQVAAFLSITRALAHLRIRLSDVAGEERWTTADHLLAELTQLDGSRIYAKLDIALFDEWRRSGARFEVVKENGDTEPGHFRFNRGDLGGSLHQGFETQGYTSIRKEPRIQINYRSVDNLADIDLDVAPWIWGFVPNPFHMTYGGSDTRQWLGMYSRKFGNPGFQVRERHACDG